MNKAGGAAKEHIRRRRHNNMLCVLLLWLMQELLLPSLRCTRARPDAITGTNITAQAMARAQL